MKFQEFNISEIFDILWEDSKLTKTFIDKNKGIFPVYSWETKNKEAYWYIDFYKYDEKLLIWTTYGDAWNLRVIEWKFNIWKNAAWLRIKSNFKNKIFIEYIKHLCEIYFKANAQWNKWELRKLPHQRVKEISIKLPIDEDGEIDLEKQKEIALKYRKLGRIKANLTIIKDDFENKVISLEDIYNWKEKKITEIFLIKQWDAFYTKKRILENNWIWDIPVYSSNTKEEWLLVWIKEEFIKEKDLYYQYCMTRSVDWYAWKIFTRNINNIENKKEEKFYFTINNHCWILLPKIENIYLPFTEMILQAKFFQASKWYGNNKLWTNQIKEITLKIPTKENGEFDLDKQKEIALKYKKLEKIQKNLIEELEYLEKVRVEI